MEHPGCFNCLEYSDLSFFSLLPEAAGDVFPRVVVGVAVEALVGGGFVEGTQVLEVRADLDVVEVVLVDLLGDAHPAAVPSHLEVGVLLVYVLCEAVDAPWLCVASHECDAGDVLAVLGHELVYGVGGEGHAHILPQILRVAAWASAGTARDVDGQGHFVGYFLEDDSCVDVLKHSLFSVCWVSHKEPCLPCVPVGAWQAWLDGFTLWRRSGVLPLPGVAVRSC